MFDGRLTRVAILFLLLAAPYAGAAPPAANRTSSDPTDGQEITDLGVDPTGQFAMAGVAFDNAKATSGLLPGSSTHRDLYLCDYGPSERPTSGSGCRGLRHPPQTVISETQAPSAPQRVAATSVEVGGRQGIFAVAGPGPYVSLWRTTSDVPEWTRTALDNYGATNVTLAPDASRIVFGTAPAASPTAPGRIEVFWSNGTRDWSFDLRSPEGGNVRPTSLAYSRTPTGPVGSVLAIGTTDGVLFADPSSGRPTSELGALSQPDAVSKVELSRDGRYLVAAASNGVFLATLERSGSRIVPGAQQIYSRTFGGVAVQDAAISGDGGRFAAAVGHEIHFYRRLDGATLAEPTGEHYRASERITDIDYDEKGNILVAIAGNQVLGFGPNKNTPIWNFTASESSRGALDGPLRRVSVSDDSQRIIVAGKTRTMPYSSIIGVSASLASTSGATTIQPTETMTLVLTVKNVGSLSDNYTFSVVAPVGWTSTSPEALRLDPDPSGRGDVASVRFNITAPPGQQPGIFGTQVRVRSQALDDIAQIRNQPTGYLAGPSFNLTVPRSVVLKVEAPDDRVLLRQGGEQTIAFTLRNEGNADGIVNLSAIQELTRGTSWDVRFQPGDQVIVPRSGTASVNMVVRAPSDAGSGDRNVITIRAREGETVEARDNLTAYVDARFGAELRTNKTTWEFYPGQTHIVTLNVTNAGNTDDVYNLSQTITPTAVQSDWRVTLETAQIVVLRGETKRITVNVKAVASDAREATLNIRAQSQNAPDRNEATLALSLLTIPRPPTDDDDDNLLPTPGAGVALVVLALVAAAARRGGRR